MKAFALAVAVTAVMLLPAAASCQVLTGSSGSYASGDTVTIYGTGLPTKAVPGPVIWCTFDDYGAGHIGDDIPDVDTRWIPDSPPNGNQLLDYTDRWAHSGTISAMADTVDEDPSGFSSFLHGVQIIEVSEYQDVMYMTSWRKTGNMDPNDFDGTALAGKWDRITSDVGDPADGYIYGYRGACTAIQGSFQVRRDIDGNKIGFGDLYDQAWGYDVHNDGTFIANILPSARVTCAFPWNGPEVRLEEYVVINTPGVYDGTVGQYTIGYSGEEQSDFYWRAADGGNMGFNLFRFGLAQQNGPTAGGGAVWRWFMDDCYADTTLVRVELGNNEVFADCTHREIQPAISWDEVSGEIQIVFNAGSFEDDDTAYLFVMDRENNPSNGVAVTVSGSGAPPGADPGPPGTPTNLRATESD